MPSTRITVSLNSNRTSKAPLLLPTPIFSSTSSERNTLQTAVFKCAQTKLRLKKPVRIYVPGGKEIVSEQDWQDVLCDDVVLLVSAGEEYVGKKDESGPPFRALDDTGDLSQDAQRLTLETPTIHNLASSSLVDPSALKQLQATAKSLPGITHAVAQPDLHPGTKFPIGAVFVSHGWIHPPLIGGDIGCGMAWYSDYPKARALAGRQGRGT